MLRTCSGQPRAVVRVHHAPRNFAPPETPRSYRSRGSGPRSRCAATAPLRTSHSNAVTSPAVSASCSPASLDRQFRPHACGARRTARRARRRKATPRGCLPARTGRVRRSEHAGIAENADAEVVVVHTMVRATMYAAAAENTGRQRAASYNSSREQRSDRDARSPRLASGRQLRAAQHVSANSASALRPPRVHAARRRIAHRRGIPINSGADRDDAERIGANQ